MIEVAVKSIAQIVHRTRPSRTRGAAPLFELPKDLRERYILRSDGFYEVSPQLRELVRFSRHDVLASQPPPGAGQFDLVCFRNLLIYLGHEFQDLALQAVGRALRPGGYLCLGEAECPSPAIATTLLPLASDTRIFATST